MPNLNTIKTVDLRKLAKKKKIPKWETIDRKPLIAALKALEPKKEQKIKKDKGAVSKKDKPKKVKKKVEDLSIDIDEEEIEEDKVVTSGISEVRFKRGGKAERMKKKLAKQPKVTILIPLGEKEPQGSTESVILNDYRLNIQKGVYVDVPRQIANVIKNSQKQTILAVNHERLLDDRVSKSKEKALDL